jgi:hypothetical protein
MKKKKKSHREDFVMGRKNRVKNSLVVGADEAFFVVTMDNGKASPALSAKQEILDWLDEHFVNTDNAVSQISVKRKKRKSALLREAERNSEIAVLEKRLDFLKSQPSVQTDGKEAL